MQLLGGTARLGEGRGFARLAGMRGRIADLVASVRSSDYVVVGGGPRFRATQRTRTRTAGRVGFLVVAGSAIFDVVALVDRYPREVLALLLLNGSMAAIALAGWWGLPRFLRRHPEPAAFFVTLALTAVTAATGVVLPGLAIETIAYLLLLPTLVALILPWRTRTHVLWLGAYGLLTFVYFLAGPSDKLSADDRGDLIVVGIVGVAASLVGHVLLQAAAIRNFSQLQRIQSLRRRADADMKELARVHKVLEETARTDPLTGAGNRVRLREDLRTARARMHRLGHSHGLLAIDLDRFKLINDRLGHLAGDEVLRSVVGAISATIRADDGVYRFGGEEFLVVLRVADRDGLAVAAERIRAAVAGLDLTHPENPPHGAVTVSIGGTLVTPADLDQTDDAWFALADAALYRAKTSGRNRVELAAP